MAIAAVIIDTIWPNLVEYQVHFGKNQNFKFFFGREMIDFTFSSYTHLAITYVYKYVHT